MARSDLLIALVKAGKATPDPRFRQAAEALIAEERAKRHDILADQISTALNAASNGQSTAASMSLISIPDLVYEINSDRTLDTLVLPSSVLKELRQLIEEQHRAELLRSYSLAPRHRLLLVGPPGNGKTSVAFALAHELMVPILAVRYEGLIGSYLGETASRLRKIFDYARQRACILFFDEFDTVGKERGDIHETGEIKRVVSTLLLQMDQLPPHVVIVTATNHPELLDRAVWRRFELRLSLPPPNPREIQEFLNRLFSGFDLDGGFKPRNLGQKLAGATYSEIEDIFKDVARRAVLESPGPDVGRILGDRIAVWQDRAVPKIKQKMDKYRD
jgi:SpoVK/Ycf46/Vps4 family AAA+-type ATPase